MKNLVTRALSGIVYIGLIVGAIFAGYIWTSALMGLFAVLAMYEFHKITILDGGYTPVRLLGLILACIAALALVFTNVSGIFGSAIMLLIAVSAVIARLVLTLYDSKSPSAFEDMAKWMLSVVYIALPLACASALWIDRFLLAVFVMIWLNDTGAYCVGSFFGRIKLFERLSPKKSWEGFFGGLVFCVAGALFFYYSGLIYGTEFWAWFGAGILTCVFATWGDLFESLIKRSYHTKDAGNLIPGHGGILDRIDSLLFVAPVLLIYGLAVSLI